MAQFPPKTQSMNTVWVVGVNQLYECGETLRSSHSSYDYDYCKTLTLCKWSTKIQNIIKINRGYGFNIYTFATKNEEFIIGGFIRYYQKLLPYQQSAFYTIPSDIYLLCLHYLGNINNLYYGAGNNKQGECGVGCFNYDPIREITAIPLTMPNINKVCIGSGGQSVIWIGSSGDVYFNGANYNNQLGVMDNKRGIATPTLSSYFKHMSLQCTDGASSNNYSMLVCNDGSVWSSGEGDSGELGHGANLQVTNTFVKIKALEQRHIMNVCTGSSFTLFLDSNGKVWSCGRNETGQCGLSHCDTDRSPLPTIITFDSSATSDYNVRITKIKCGMDHSVAMDTRSNIYTWGSNEFGQCAMNKTLENGDTNESIAIPSMVLYFVRKPHQRVVDIKSGSYHTGVITEDEQYYIWGCNDYNECCLEQQSNDHVSVPQCINDYVYKGTNCIQIFDMSLGDCNTMIIVSEIIYK